MTLGTPAATVALLRDSLSGLEVLMLQKAKAQRFGGLWVFPGGAFDTSDEMHHEDGSLDVLATAANAVVRETAEETQLSVDPSSLNFLAHWTPPKSDVSKRGKGFSTFFFVGREHANASVDSVLVDGGEINRSLWLRPSDALDRHANGELGMLPPTFMTLDTLVSSGAASADDALRTLQAHAPMVYETRSARLDDGRMAFMWEGDAGWPQSDGAVQGPKFRLVTKALDGSDAAPAKPNNPLDSLAEGKAVLVLQRDAV
jgi:8-oxo-dGTP pyrophosphatase MutT (NUDIX family)